MHDAGSDGSVSNKETVKSWDDVPHAFDNLLKRQVHRFTWHRGILPRYVDNSLALHWHIALKGGLFSVVRFLGIVIFSGSLTMSERCHALNSTVISPTSPMVSSNVACLSRFTRSRSDRSGLCRAL